MAFSGPRAEAGVKRLKKVASHLEELKRLEASRCLPADKEDLRASSGDDERLHPFLQTGFIYAFFC